jgi:aminocarboxymuconate-semialdehyde decarboxylase
LLYVERLTVGHSRDVRSQAVIDVHAHLLPQSAVRAAREGTEWFGSTIEQGSDGRPVIVTGTYRVGMGATEHWDPPSSRVERMDALSVDVQVLSLNPILFRYYLDPVNAVPCCRAVNDEIAGMVETWPDRFAGFATLPLQRPDAAVAELERAVTDLGLVGAAVGTHVSGANWDEPHLFGVLEAAERLGALLFIHPSASRLKEALPRYHLRNLIANPTETTIAIGSLIFGGVLDRVPNLDIVFAHGGGYACWASGRFDHGYQVRREAHEHAELFPSDYLRRLHYDSLVHNHRNLRQLIDTVGIDRVVLGTDYPADMGQPHPVAWIAGSDLDDHERSAVLGRNAVRLLSNRIASWKEPTTTGGVASATAHPNTAAHRTAGGTC